MDKWPKYPLRVNHLDDHKEKSKPKRVNLPETKDCRPDIGTIYC